MKPDRVVIGADSPKAIQLMNELYAPFVRTGKPILVMDIRSAEMTKYAANAMLATRISFMNEIAALCERLGANVDLVRKGVGSDVRIGPSFLFPGPGYGGSCFPKDVRALVQTARQRETPLMVTKRSSPRTTVRSGGCSRSSPSAWTATFRVRVAVWGLSFKPNTDDMRESPALALIESVLLPVAPSLPMIPRPWRKQGVDLAIASDTP
jgi:UDPglucose 6-dehydrogenase